MVIDIIERLKAEVARIQTEAAKAIAPIQDAIEALEDEHESRTAGRQLRLVRRGGITPEGRKRLSLAMKQRWADRKITARRKAS